MGLKNGLYIMLYNQYEDGDEDFENDKYTKCIGAEHVGEIPRQFRGSFLGTLINRLNKRYGGEPRPYRMDFCYQDGEGDSIYPENLTEDKLLNFLLEGKTMSSDQREMLDAAVGIANDMKQYLAETDEPITQKSAEWGSAPDVNVANMLSKKDVADATFDGTYRAMARFQEPDEEVEIEKVDRLRKEGWKWKQIVKEVYPDTQDENLNSEVDRVRAQHKREFPDSYSTEK